MTAPELLADLHRRGVRLSAAGERLRVEAPAGTLGDGERATIAERKCELLALLSQTGAAGGDGAPPWNQSVGLAQRAVATHQAAGWPDDAEGCRRLGEKMDAIDAAFLERDLAGLRRAVQALLDALPPPTTRALELWPPFFDGPRLGQCPGCAACQQPPRAEAMPAPAAPSPAPKSDQAGLFDSERTVRDD